VTARIPLFLQMKEAEASVLEEFVAPSEFDNHGERVVTGSADAASSDIFLAGCSSPASTARNETSMGAS